MQENLVFRKRDLTIVQGAAFRVQKRGNNTYSIEADGTAFEDVVILVRNTLSIFYPRRSNLHSLLRNTKFQLIHGIIF